MLKQNPAYEWLLFIFFLTACTGCGIINGDLEEAIQYQVAKRIVNEGKRQLKEDLESGISYDEYEQRQRDLKTKSPKGNLVEHDFFVLTKKGKIRLPKEEEILNEKVNKIIGLRKDSDNFHLSGSFSFDRATVTIDYGRFEVKLRQYYDGSSKFFFEYEIKF